MTPEQIEILTHTSRNGRYVGSDAELLALAADGYLHDHGPQALAGGDHYMVMTAKGAEALREHRDNLPRAKRPTKARLRYQRFLSVRDAFGCSFREFLTLEANQP